MNQFEIRTFHDQHSNIVNPMNLWDMNRQSYLKRSEDHTQNEGENIPKTFTKGMMYHQPEEGENVKIFDFDTVFRSL